MPWPLIFLGTLADYPDPADFGMARIPVGGYFFRSGDKPLPGLGSVYLTTAKAHRLPVYIHTPGGWWSPDEMAYSGDRGWYGNGWTVTGTFPLISVTPSINFPGRYHGWCTLGVLSDDLEGRVFPALKPAS